MCDVAYVILAEQLERQTVADWQAAAIAQAIGGGDRLPDLGSHLVGQRDAMNGALVAAPVPVGLDDEQLRIRRALGVA